MPRSDAEIRMAVQAERAACAQLVDDYARVWEPGGSGKLHTAAEAIRLRGLLEALAEPSVPVRQAV